MDIQQVANDIQNEKIERNSDWKKQVDSKSSQQNSSSIKHLLRKVARRVPGFRYLYGIHTGLSHLNLMAHRFDSLQREFWTLNHKFIMAQNTIEHLQKENQTLSDRSRVLSQKIENLTFPNPSSETDESPKPSAANVNFAQLYRAFEDQFRGDEAEIKAQQNSYIEKISSIPEALKKDPIVLLPMSGQTRYDRVC